MNKTAIKLICILISTCILPGCSLKPPPHEVHLPEQNTKLITLKKNVSRLIIFNNSNSYMYGSDSSGLMNIYIDGKGVGQLKIDEYLVVDLWRGLHRIKLEHQDIFNFTSTFKIALDPRTQYVEIYAELFSNGLKLTHRPLFFESNFKVANERKAPDIHIHQPIELKF